jgi:hypothetical protein
MPKKGPKAQAHVPRALNAGATVAVEPASRKGSKAGKFGCPLPPTASFPDFHPTSLPLPLSLLILCASCHWHPQLASITLVERRRAYRAPGRLSPRSLILELRDHTV